VSLDDDEGPPYTSTQSIARGLCGWCTTKPATEPCSRHKVAVPTMCRACHAAVRLSYPCKCMTTEEALRIHKEEEEMGAKKKTEGGNGEKLPAGVPKGAVARDKYEEKLPCQADDKIIATKARELAKLEHARTQFRASWKAVCAKTRERRAFFEERIEELAAEVDGQVEYENVEVQEYLLPTNEVIAVRLDTGEVVSTRTAESEDLQDRIAGTGDAGKKKGKRAKSDDVEETI
jgi:hypothetical protein